MSDQFKPATLSRLRQYLDKASFSHGADKHAALECLQELGTFAEEAQDTLEFVERWAVHHGSKTTCTPREALSAIQHYGAIKAITNGYRDGVVPNTFDPYARIKELEGQLAEIVAGGVESPRQPRASLTQIEEPAAVDKHAVIATVTKASDTLGAVEFHWETGALAEGENKLYLHPSPQAQADAQSAVMKWNRDAGLLWDVFAFGVWSHRVVSPLNCDAHSVYLALVRAGYADHIDVRLVSASNNSGHEADSSRLAFVLSEIRRNGMEDLTPALHAEDGFPLDHKASVEAIDRAVIARAAINRAAQAAQGSE